MDEFSTEGNMVAVSLLKPPWDKGMDEWTDDRTDGWMDGKMYGWTDGWMDG